MVIKIQQSLIQSVNRSALMYNFVPALTFLKTMSGTNQSVWNMTVSSLLGLGHHTKLVFALLLFFRKGFCVLSTALTPTSKQKSTSMMKNSLNSLQTYLSTKIISVIY